MFKLSISNIAWTQHDDPAVLNLLLRHGFSGIEIAPTKIWPNWEGAGLASSSEYRKRMADAGLSIPALQAILYGKPELKVFSPASHCSFLKHMTLVAEIAEGVGASVLVFGAPKNRRRGSLGYQQAMDTAAALFRQFGQICGDHGCVLGIEANPAEYCCDFINNTADAMEFVQYVDSPAVKLHIDSGATLMNGENLNEVIADCKELCHYHISEPLLANIADGQVDQLQGLNALKARHYNKWASIEMRTESPEYQMIEKALIQVEEALANAKI